ncbi:MAG: Ppx/GppA phosphatase family protein, partial [Microbacterium gubbeenense]
MRLGVLDIGSNTVHLLVADAQPGGRPLASTSEKSTVRVMRYLLPDGSISQEGIDAILSAVARARAVADTEGVSELLATATSAIREATNGADVIAQIEAVIGMSLQVLGGSEEARFTFLAARRWFGWSAGQILLFDIGGGSLEIAGGADELPQLAESVPLGAGRMTVEMLPTDPPGDEAVERLAFHAEEQLAAVAA